MKRRENLFRYSALTILFISMMAAASAQGASPQLQNISIYDVTDSTGEQRYTGGELLSYGTNTTFILNQTQDARDLRFSFRVTNDAASDWNITAEDDLFHDGLDTGWSINRTWYNTSGTTYEGGTFSGGRVEWNTQDGGNLTSTGDMHAKYIVEVDLPASQQYDQRFVANDTDNTQAAEDEHVLDMNRLGALSLTLEEPPNQTVLTQNKTFQVNSTVSCTGGECGDITATARYNQSSTADTLIPADSGQPFHTIGPNSESCNDLLAGEQCSVLWDVNATGQDSTLHLLDTNVSSSYEKINSQQTADTEVEIKQVVLLNITWNSTDFGLLDPGQTQQPASNNSDLLYNVSILDYSNDADIWIKGSDLVSQKDQSYSIGIGNMTFALENLYSSSSPIQKTYQLLKSSVSAGTTLNTFYWLDVPTGIIEGDYNGSITFKANLTQG